MRHSTRDGPSSLLNDASIMINVGRKSQKATSRPMTMGGSVKSPMIVESSLMMDEHSVKVVVE